MSGFLWFVIWGAAIFLMMRFGCGAHVMGHDEDPKDTGDREKSVWVPPETDTDPVCGKTIKTADAKPSVFDGHVYYFCSRDCRERFEAAPDLYLGGNSEAPMKQLGETHA